MRMPPSISSGVLDVVCRLRKSLYVMKEASRQWYAKLIEMLYARGYKYSSNDCALFCKKTKSSVVFFLATYVDDILVTRDDGM